MGKFVQIMTHFDRSMLTERELLDAFLGFDRHKNDSIDALELANIIERLGFQIHPLEAHAMIQSRHFRNRGGPLQRTRGLHPEKPVREKALHRFAKASIPSASNSLPRPCLSR